MLSNRAPVPDLPKGLYDREWLDGLEEGERDNLGVTDEEFEWMVITEAPPSREM